MKYNMKSLKRMVGGGEYGDIFAQFLVFIIPTTLGGVFIRLFAVICIIFAFLIPLVFVKDAKEKKKKDNKRASTSSELTSVDRICSQYNDKSTCESTSYNDNNDKCVYNAETSQHNRTCWTKSELEKQQDNDDTIYGDP
jgi:hypothetical protein